MLFQARDDVKVIRLKYPITSTQSFKIEQYARSKTGSIYSIKEAILTVSKSDTDATAKSSDQFCSRLVANSYKFADINIVKNADYCSPNDIFLSNCFEEVADIIKEANSGEIKFAESSDPVLENQRRAYKFINGIRKLAKHYDTEIATLNDVDDFIINNPFLDEKAAKILQNSKYLDHYDVDKSLNPHRYDIGKLEIFYKNSGVLPIQIIDSILPNEYEVYRHQTRNLSNANDKFPRKLKYFNLQRKLLINVLRLSLERLLTINKFSQSHGLNNKSNEIEILVSAIRSQI